ncbi:murein L,D-transpeptidase YcbB/YkuD [Chitinophaga niastensis]|uniref:Murein L,D-transpeptidase YcbB/YkuD n=1 Tax=Chitinophaga niastensis TaxID=536980 RepID=A0A2P8HNI9_CHINA|nr:L,D-transpeptidase family protein [Chitinophaga niastensis]PSL47789.1 murein L,D-transpeptidase YcbB/YkuD [Chitinophaga niastensis]
MKRLLIIALLTYMAINGCNAPFVPVTVKDSITLTPRNSNITKENAFNDLFLDSNVVEKFMETQKLDDTTANRLRSFYNARNFEFAWLDSKGPIEQAAAFSSLYNYNKDSVSNKALNARLDVLAEEDSLKVTASDPAMIKTELQLTLQLINYFKEKSASIGQLEHMVPVQRYAVMELADSMLQTNDKMFPGVEPMKAPLKAYLKYARNGGWPIIPVVKKGWKKGQSSPEIMLAKKRLFITGELKNNDTTSLFTDELEAAVNTFRNSHGYTQNGVVNDTVINAMNISATARLQQLLVNMERMKWMPVEPAGKLILVNIPAFVLHVTNGSTQLFDMDIVVGKEGHSTTMFSGQLNQVVFSPYWNIPRSIVRKEILPAMRRRKNYLASRNMEITREANGIPVVRQRPGKRNALGRVKFLFPNSYHIYFHDTPEKGLFNRDNRAYSHGCIRLKDPVRMARFVLEDSPKWTNEKIDSAMNSGKQRFVALKHPVPVIITYFTAWLNGGGLHFAEDVYGHDAAFSRKLFQ